MKKLAILTMAICVGFSVAEANNKKINLAKAEGNEQIYIPKSVTSKLYKFADALKDDRANVDRALSNWYSDSYKGVKFIETLPTVYNEETLRKTIDSFYVTLYLTNNFVVEYNTLSYAQDEKRMLLDHLVPIRESFEAVLNEYQHPARDIEYIYGNVRYAYETVREAYTYLEEDMGNYVDSFSYAIVDAKAKLAKGLNDYRTRSFDVTDNKFYVLKEFVDMVCEISETRIGLGSKQSIYDEVENVLFNQNVPVEDLFDSTYLDFEVSDVGEVESAIYVDDQAAQEAIEPYNRKLMDQIILRFIQFEALLNCYCNNYVSMKQISGWIWPLLYKLLDLADAIKLQDPINMHIIGFECEEDFCHLFEDFITEDTVQGYPNFINFDIKQDLMDLKVEKYMSAYKLGAVLDGFETKEKMNIYNEVLAEINEVTCEENPISYEAACDTINGLVNEGVKKLNVLTRSNDNEIGINDIGKLIDVIENRNFRATFEVNKADVNAAIDAQQQIDYEGHLLGLDSHYFTMNLDYEDNTSVKDNLIQNPVNLKFDYDLSKATNVKVYRYDETRNQVISLDNERNNEDVDYFLTDGNTITIVTKEFGLYSIAYNNADVEALYASLQDQINALNEAITAKAAEITSLTGQVQTLSAQVESLQAQIAALQNQVNSLTATNNTQKETIESLNTQLVEMENQVAELEVQIQQYESSHTSEVNTLTIVFIILSCLLAIVDGIFVFLYLKKKKEAKQ